MSFVLYSSAWKQPLHIHLSGLKCHSYFVPIPVKYSGIAVPPIEKRVNKSMLFTVKHIDSAFQ